MTKQALSLLKKLIEAHSTPGDELAVADILVKTWQRAGWQVSKHGNYAISARSSTGVTKKKKPRLLICAHMDSPGFIVDRTAWQHNVKTKKSRVHLVELGSPYMNASSVTARLKCRNGCFGGKIRRRKIADEETYHFEMSTDSALRSALHIGDRVCFAGTLNVDNDLISAPFLDNRLGCWMLCRLAQLKTELSKEFEVILGATSAEEITGMGAHVLAAQVPADLVIVLDATYENAKQSVHSGNGAVLTLSDKSILLSSAHRDHIIEIMDHAGIPLQFEAYNYSGTDARAFPMQGSTAPVIALLLPTRGNHSPCEIAALRDLEKWEKAIRALCGGWGHPPYKVPARGSL